MQRRALGLHWDLRPDLIFLNHGSFGLAPRELLQWRVACLQEIERDPVAFLVDQLPQALDEARRWLAHLVGASVDQLAFVPSTTHGLNELLQRLHQLVPSMPPGSEILVTNHGYNATGNLVRYAAEQRGWRLREVPLPPVIQHPDQVVEAFERAWGATTRLIVLDHITSPTALILPVAALIALARSRGAAVIVDGAHAPGSVPLNLEQLQPNAYVGNLHKWLCCPRGSAFLWVCPSWRDRLRPLVISHGANAPVHPGGSRFQLEHDWIGTADPTPWLALPQALTRLGGSSDRERACIGLHRRMQRQRDLALAGERLLVEQLGVMPSAPPECRAAMAALPLATVEHLDGPALQRRLLQHGFQVPIIPLQPHRQGQMQYLRFSCFAYNTLSDLQALATTLANLGVTQGSLRG